MFAAKLTTVAGLLLLAGCSDAAELRYSQIDDGSPLQLPKPGAYQLRVIAPTILELTLITTKKSPEAPAVTWNFADDNGRPHLPTAKEFSVTAGGNTVTVKTVGFKRRVLYAPFKERDLRIGNYLYLELDRAPGEGEAVEVKNPGGKLWGKEINFASKADPMRWSPVIHVNQVGYMPAESKKAMVGYYLGNLGELKLDDASRGFKILDAQDKVVFSGSLAPRPDVGFPNPCYQRVLEADFSALRTPGEYRLVVAGLGASFPFTINEGVAAAFARTYALGIYHQRCGTGNDLPFTRFTHKPCHTAPAEVPIASAKYESQNEVLAGETANANSRQTAPPLKNLAASLYPFVNRGPVDVRGGHHDAGDYSKYTINSAAFIHQLVFAVDVFPGVSDLDNLGLPESGDGKSDVLQEAKWEADFLAKMQDADGGFYFLVYPRERRYENNVTPDEGDPQIVWPKTTSVTAAAVAALAQCASSPTFKRQFPAEAKAYLEKARKGWKFLDQAIAKFGKDGAYQKITHYGDEFMHDDELAWAACELYLATGEKSYDAKLAEWLKPADPETRKWNWLRLYDSYGNAIRSYAFAAKAGKMKREQLSPALLRECENEIVGACEDQLRRAQQSAYGTSFPEETKRVRSAGWYFSGDAAFDLAVAMQLDYPARNDPRPKMREALLSNLNYEAGCNPVNVTYLTGVGWKRQREIVHQYAQNDRRVLPPSGIPLGNIQGGFGWLDFYQKELGALSFPSDGSETDPYPFYDRWGDSFNLSQEFVIINQARALAYLSWLMAESNIKTQAWKAASAQITAVPNATASSIPPGGTAFQLVSSGLDLSNARIVWEAAEREPLFGKTFTFTPASKTNWIEAEAQLPDGRRVFAVTNLANRPK